MTPALACEAFTLLGDHVIIDKHILTGISYDKHAPSHLPKFSVFSFVRSSSCPQNSLRNMDVYARWCRAKVGQEEGARVVQKRHYLPRVCRSVFLCCFLSFLPESVLVRGSIETSIIMASPPNDFEIQVAADEQVIGDLLAVAIPYCPFPV